MRSSEGAGEVVIDEHVPNVVLLTYVTCIWGWVAWVDATVRGLGTRRCGEVDIQL